MHELDRVSDLAAQLQRCCSSRLAPGAAPFELRKLAYRGKELPQGAAMIHYAGRDSSAAPRFTAVLAEWYQLRLVPGEGKPFSVTMPSTSTLADLRKAIDQSSRYAQACSCSSQITQLGLTWRLLAGALATAASSWPASSCWAPAPSSARVCAAAL